LKNVLIFEKKGGADAFENDPPFISKGTVDSTAEAAKFVPGTDFTAVYRGTQLYNRPYQVLYHYVKSNSGISDL
jgi:hypothetical protein